MACRTGHKLGIVIGVVLVAVSACTPVQYVGGPQSGTVLVIPSKSWYRPGTTAKETFDQRQACAKESESDAEFLRLMQEAKKMPKSYSDRTRKQNKIMMEPINYQAGLISHCLVSKGYKYGKVRPEQVYIRPPEPRKDWVKAGASREEYESARDACRSVDFTVEQETKCMGDHGFRYEVVDPHPTR